MDGDILTTFAYCPNTNVQRSYEYKATLSSTLECLEKKSENWQM